MAVTLPIPPDTALITDDGCATGVALVDTTTGTIIGFTDAADFACGSESGATMLDGTICTTDNTSGSGNGVVNIYDGNLVLITSITLGTPPDAYPTGITTDRVTYFYVIVADGSDNLTLYKIDKTGATINSWDLSTTFASDPVACAVTRDNAILYFASDFSGQIKKIDLGSGTVSVATTISTFPTWLGVGADGNIYVNRTVSAVAKIEKYDSSFAFVSSVNGGPTGYTLDVAHFSADDANLFTWTQKSSGISHPDKYSAFRKIKLSDLSVISDIANIPTETNSAFITPGTSISNSCPLMISGTPPPPCSAQCEPCEGGLRRIEIHLNGVRIASAQASSANELILPLSYLVEGLRNDKITVHVYQSNPNAISVIPAIQMHRVTYVTHDKAVGRNRAETIDPRSGADLTGGANSCDENSTGSCVDCVSATTPPPVGPSWYTALTFTSNCFNLTDGDSFEATFNAQGFSYERNSGGQFRGRVYLGFPVPDFSKTVDLVRPDCGWGFIQHGF